MSEDEQHRKRGGARIGAGAKSTWKTPGKTKLVRIPEQIADKVLEAARAIDDGYRLVRGKKDRRRLQSGWIRKERNKPNRYKKRSYVYYRYQWYEGSQIQRCGIPSGTSQSESGYSNLQLVEQAIAERKSPLEIVQMIKSWKTCPRPAEVDSE